MMDNDFTPDSIVQSIIKKFTERAKKGKEKYGTDMDREDLSIIEWINHAQEEHMDAIVYLEKLKKTILEKEKTSDSISKTGGEEN